GTLLLGPAVAFADDLKDPYAGDASRPPGLTAPPAAQGDDFRYKVLFKVDLDYTLNDASVSDAAYARSLALQRPTAPGAVDGRAAIAALPRRHRSRRGGRARRQAAPRCADPRADRSRHRLPLVRRSRRWPGQRAVRRASHAAHRWRVAYAAHRRQGGAEPVEL